MKKFLIILLALSFISIPVASAHPFTDKTIPNLGSNAPVGITEVIVYFSEPVDINFSEIKVFDSNGNQIDDKDTDYYEDELSLIVTTPPLDDGVYTASVKVLSKVDGHLVPSAFLFGVGDVIIKDPNLPQVDSEIIFLPEAGARFPGILGQSIVLGAVIASLLIWGTQNKLLLVIKNELDKIEIVHHVKFMSITGIGLMLVFVSDILMIVVQTIRLETSPLDVIGTYFGTVWLARMIITIALLGIWFGMNRKKTLSKKGQIPMLIISLALISTSSLIGHGAASGQTGAIVLDYIHNLVSAVWIGGIIYFVFTLLPTFSQLKDTITREKMSLLAIPRFSIAFIISIGIVIITGPTLMWFLESDVGLITESVFGQLIILKIAIAAIIVGLGGFLQFNIQKNAEKNFLSGKITVHKKLKKSLKVEAMLGIILLGVVALLTNGTLPAGEIQKVDAQEIVYGFKTTQFSENAKFEIDISPFSSGTNTIFVKVSDFEGKQLYDSEEIHVKISNPSKNISPIKVSMSTKNLSDPIQFEGELTFGFSGKWLVEIEAQRTLNANESVMLDLLVKPRLANIQTQVIEYELPETDAKPLFPVYDGQGSLWISDAYAPRLWEFSLETNEFTSYLFDGNATTFLTQDNKGRIWFTDTPNNQIGFVDIESKEITTKTLPELDPIVLKNIPLFIKADFDGNIWITVLNKDRILKYLPDEDSFEEIILPDKQSLPFALATDKDGKIWYSTTSMGKIGFIDPQTNEPTQISTKTVLQGPEFLIFDDDGNLWIAEHTGLAITKFNPILETFDKITVPDENALPFGMTFDRYGNIWFAQHNISSLGVYDPDNNDLLEIPIQTEASLIQFMTSDKDGNVWFVEQGSNKIGTVKLTEIPVSISQIQESDGVEIKYTELASPLVALGIIATSLFFVKSLKDKRRLNSLVNS